MYYTYIWTLDSIDWSTIATWANQDGKTIYVIVVFIILEIGYWNQGVHVIKNAVIDAEYTNKWPIFKTSIRLWWLDYMSLSISSHVMLQHINDIDIHSDINGNESLPQRWNSQFDQVCNWEWIRWLYLF